MELMEVPVEANRLDKVSVTYSPKNGSHLNIISFVEHLEVVGDERVIFKSDSQHLLVWADVKAQGLPIVIFSFESFRDLDQLEVEEPDVGIVAGSYYEQVTFIILASY